MVKSLVISLRVFIFIMINMNALAHIREKTEIQMPTHVNRDKSVADFWLCKYKFTFSHTFECHQLIRAI